MKWFALLGLLLFLGVAVAPNVVADDTLPPVTSILLNPVEPNGENGWYISNVTITLNATDNESGVKVTYYAIGGGQWQKYTEPFNVSNDGIWEIDYFSIDNSSNPETPKTEILKIDQQKPRGTAVWVGDPRKKQILFTMVLDDDTSGDSYVDFYMNFQLMHTDDTPPYEWIVPYEDFPEGQYVLDFYGYDEAGWYDIDSPPKVEMIHSEDEDCGCEEQTTGLWNYPFICSILFVPFVFFMTLVIMGLSIDTAFKLDNIADDLNCYWKDILPN